MFSIKVPVFSIGDQRDTFPKQPSFFHKLLTSYHRILILSYYILILKLFFSVELGRTWKSVVTEGTNERMSKILTK